MRTLLVTNDFPPRPGGIQQFVHNLAVRMPEGSLTAYSSDWRGSAEFDAQQTFPVVRENTKVLLPTKHVARRAAQLGQDCDSVLFGAAAPLGLLASGLKQRTGIERAVGITHGHEVGWAMLPGARWALKRIADGCDVITYLTEYQRSRLDPLIGSCTSLQRLTPGVDSTMYHPGIDGAAVRARYGLSDRPVIVCVSRLVARKGQDTLVETLPLVRKAVPDAALFIVGGGPHRKQIERRVAELKLERDVVLTGTVPWRELPEHYAAGDVFAMPCRTRNRGLDVEGLGIVYLEASATGLPVVAGDSGGAPDAVRAGETGFVVPGLDREVIADRLITLLTDGALARKMGEAGRAWVEAEWGWDRQAVVLQQMLAGT